MRKGTGHMDGDPSDTSLVSVHLMEFDHLVLTCDDLDAGAAWLEARLGVPTAPGSGLPSFRLRSRQVSLGAGAFLELFGPDRDAPPHPDRPRWLSPAGTPGAPHLTAWVLRSAQLDTAIEFSRMRHLRVVRLTRGDGRRMRLAVPPGGALPLDGVYPAMVAWEAPHPTIDLPDPGCRLESLAVRHPQAERIFRSLSLSDMRVEVQEAPPGLEAVIATPSGARVTLS